MVRSPTGRTSIASTTSTRGEFVPARDALARELRKAGDRPAAVAVRDLRRPTVTAWALNQVARRQPDDVAALLEAAEAVGAAQAAAVSSGTPEALRAATRRRRELVAVLARAATALAGPTHADEVEATLLSAGTRVLASRRPGVPASRRLRDPRGAIQRQHGPFDRKLTSVRFDEVR